MEQIWRSPTKNSKVSNDKGAIISGECYYELGETTGGNIHSTENRSSATAIQAPMSKGENWENTCTKFFLLSSDLLPVHLLYWTQPEAKGKGLGDEVCKGQHWEWAGEWI